VPAGGEKDLFFEALPKKNLFDLEFE